MDLNDLRKLAGLEEVFEAEEKEPKTVSLKNDLNEVTSRSGKYILVHDPISKDSEVGDMIAVVDGDSFANIFIGASQGRGTGGMGDVPKNENWMLYHDNQIEKALKDINSRLKKAGIDAVVTESVLTEAKVVDTKNKKKILDLVKATADHLEDMANESKSRIVKSTHLRDADYYDKIADACAKGDHKAARRLYRNMDTGARDVIFDLAKGKNLRKALAEYLDVELLHENDQVGDDDLNEAKKSHYAPSESEKSMFKSLANKLKKSHPDKEVKCSTKDGMAMVNGKVAYDMSATIGNQQSMDDKYKKMEKTLLGESLNEDATNKNTLSLLDLPTEWMDDKNEEKKVEVPSSVKKALKDKIENELRLAKELDKDQPDQSKYHEKVADNLEVMLNHLNHGTCGHCKKAAIHLVKVMGDIMHEVPAEVVTFLTQGVKVTLKNYFNVAKAGK